LLDGQYYALKKINLRAKGDIKEHKVLREIQTMTKLNHSNVVRYYTCWLEPMSEEDIEKFRRKFEKRQSLVKKRSMSNHMDRQSLESSKEEERERLSDSAFEWNPFEESDDFEIQPLESKLEEESDLETESQNISQFISTDSRIEFAKFNREEYFKVLIQMELCQQHTL
jgi:translation initiation factor 2-alpha kinase 4